MAGSRAVRPGDLRGRLDRYIALRRAVGFAMRAEERLLLDFVIYVEQRGLDAVLPARAAVEWACHGGGCSPSAQTRRLAIVRAFLAYVRAELPQIEAVPHGVIGAGLRRRRPYIFTDAELAALIDAAGRLGPADALRPYTHATVLGLLASCGLRAGEAVRLRVEDALLDLDPPRLQVLGTKFRKSRLVPIHPSTVRALRAYASHRVRLGYDGICDRFFVSERPGAIRYQSIRRTFKMLVRRLAIGVGPRSPRLHDLRHTFAVRRLVAWYREGVDVHGRMPVLSTYLGHCKPADTYWYLTAVPELLGCAAQRFDAFVNAGGPS
jgi:integrase